MMSEKPSLVFFGSGPVAAESLRLLATEFAIEAVITKPTTEREMASISPDSPLFCVTNKTELDKLFFEHKFSSKLGILIDFGIIVSQQVIDYFPFGIVNSHFSLLPELRGADPISFAILEGKPKTGVSLMLLVEAMDEGPILSTGEYELEASETAPSLTAKLIILSYELLKNIIPKYTRGEIKLVTQEFIAEEFSRQISYTRKLTKQDGVIDWNKPAEQLEREIRAFIEWPRSHTTLGSVEVILTKARVAQVNYPDSKPGDIEVINEVHMLRVECGLGSLWVDTLKPTGKKEMSVEAFLAGYKNKLNI